MDIETFNKWLSLYPELTEQLGTPWAIDVFLGHKPYMAETPFNNSGERLSQQKGVIVHCYWIRECVRDQIARAVFNEDRRYWRHEDIFTHTAAAVIHLHILKRPELARRLVAYVERTYGPYKTVKNKSDSSNSEQPIRKDRIAR